MFRSLTLFCVVTAIALSPFPGWGLFAQDTSTKPEKVKVTPEILSLFNEAQLSLTTAEPKLRAGGLFQWLGFAVHFDDNAHTRKIANDLLTLAPSIEPVELRNQLHEGVANVLCELEEYAEAASVLNRIVNPAERYGSQLNLAIRLVREREEDKTRGPFDATELLRGAIAGAVGANDAPSEAAARIFLGRELARQGKQAESVAAFAEVMRTAQKVASAEQKGDIVNVLFQSQVLYDQMDGARATLQTISDPEYRQLCVEVLLQNNKYDEAERLLKTFPASGNRDLLLYSFAVESIKTITDEKIAELLSLVSSDEQRERFLQRLVTELQKNERGDLAVQTGKRLKKGDDATLALFIGKVSALIIEKRFAEAVQLIDQSEVEETIRRQSKQQILAMQYQETHEEAVVQQIAESFTTSEKIAINELNEEAKKAAQLSNSAEQMEIFWEILQEQLQLMDLAGARQTMQLFATQLDKETDPVRLIQHRLLLARLQAEIREKQKLKENLGKLTQMLSAITDLKVLKDLAPQQPQQAPAAAPGGAIRLDLPGMGGAPVIDESAIRDQLFQVYLLIASQFAKADAQAESKAAIEKAKALARLDQNAVQKSEKLLILAQFLADDHN